MSSKSVRECFLEKIVVDSKGCWIWIGCKSLGYGVMRIKRKFNVAHRISYELFKGDIPEGMVIDHLCRNRACVNYEHLEAVTTKENILRGKGICAVNARKTHCKRGHEFTLENTYITSIGGRMCRACQNKRARKYY